MWQISLLYCGIQTLCPFGHLLGESRFLCRGTVTALSCLRPHTLGILTNPFPVMNKTTITSPTLHLGQDTIVTVYCSVLVPTNHSKIRHKAPPLISSHPPSWSAQIPTAWPCAKYISSCCYVLLCM